MSTRKVFVLLLTISGIVFIPYISAFYIFDGSFPHNYFKFPPDRQIKAPTSLTVIIITSLISIALLSLYLFPNLFGFKKSTTPKKSIVSKKILPSWFWVGLVMFTVPLILFIVQASEPKWIVNWGLLPLFWGFTLMLDGVLFSINDGQSLVSTRPTELVTLGIVSISGWLLFEYLNFFIRHNWFYPHADFLQHDEFVLYATLGSSGFIPMAFEWYYILRKSSVLNRRYANGPKLRWPKWLLYLTLALCFLGLAVTPAKPDNLFFIIWLAPMIIIAIVLTLIGIWTPFTPIKHGDWTALLIFGLTFLIQGFLLEFWNYISASHLSDGEILTKNPAYWIYCIPYVSELHVFEMPLLGYVGYLFFSIHCYLWWITFYHLMGVKVEFGEQEALR